MLKILLFTVHFHGYENIIIDSLKRQGYDVQFFDYNDIKYTEVRKIKNPFLKIWNNIYLRKVDKNLKDIRKTKALNLDLLSLKEKYDYIIKIGDIKLDKSTLKILKTKAKILICHNWDKIIDEEYFLLEKNYFQKIFSYSKEDAEKYNITYLPNFYFQKIKNIEIKNDVFAILSDLSRKELLEKIARNLHDNGIKYSLNLIGDNKKRSNFINIKKEKISLEEVLEKYQESRAILELVREKNYGVSTFRAIECIGLEKKLITNNKEIINEDFYDKDNIFIINEKELYIPKEFIYSPYKKLPKNIVEKYYIDNWITRLLSV